MTWEWTTVAILPLSGVALKDSDYDKSLQWSELNMDLPFFGLQYFWEKKSLFVDLQKTLFLLRVFHTALFLYWKLISYQINDSDTLELMQFTGLIMFPIILKPLAWQGSGTALWRLSCGASWVSTLCRAEVNSPRIQYIHWASSHHMVPLLSFPKIKGWKWDWLLLFLISVVH